MNEWSIHCSFTDNEVLCEVPYKGIGVGGDTGSQMGGVIQIWNDLGGIVCVTT